MSYRSYQNFKFTPVLTLVVINLILFVGYLINRDLFLSFFGLSPAWFFSRPWTIVTAMFMHAGFWHIIANMLTLYFFGNFFSGLVGNKKFLLVYFCGGLLGNIFFIASAMLGLSSPFSIAVGASGAVFAIGGALAVMRPQLKVFIMFIPIPVPLWVAIIIGFVVIGPNIAWQAHLGGLIFGLIAGYFFRRRERSYYWR